MLLSPSLLNGLEQFRIDSRKRFLGAKAGSHRSLKRGHGIEFSDYRQYEPGDNPRQIDWRVYGRTDRLYIKQFQEEQDLKVSVILDSSASMSPTAKWDLAITTALSLAYLAVMQQDSVRIGTAANPNSPFMRGNAALHQLNSFLEKTVPHKKLSLSQLLESQIASLRSPGIALLLSDFLYPLSEIENTLRFIRSRNMDGAYIAILSKKDLYPLEANQAALIEDCESGKQQSIIFDSETQREYTKRLTAHITRVRDLCRQHDLGFALIREGDNFLESLMNQKQGLRILS